MKESEIKIIGKMDDEIKEETKRKVVKELEEYVAEVLTVVKKLELPRSEEDLKMIEKMNLWLEEYLINIGAEESVKKIRADQFMILSESDFVKVGASVFEDDWSGAYGKMVPGVDIIFVKKLSEKDKFVSVVSILHEMVHLNSVFKLNISKNEGGEGFRLGYSIKPNRKDDGDAGDKPRYMDGLNEAIVQMVTLDILTLKHAEELESDFGITKEDQTEFWSKDGYAGYEYIFGIVIRRLAKELGLSSMDQWQKFRKNLFTGNLMFLRDVEKVFGKGSLRVLAFMGSHVSHARSDNMLRLFEKYFLTENQIEREEVAEKIFSNDEDKGYFEKYKKRLEK